MVLGHCNILGLPYPLGILEVDSFHFLNEQSASENKVS